VVNYSTKCGYKNDIRVNMMRH